MRTVSVKLPRELSERVARLARDRRTTVSAVIRDAVEQYSSPARGSFAEAASRYIGSLEGGPGDLATNPAHLDGFGR